MADYDESRDEKWNWDKVFNRQDAEEEYRKAYQTNSRALYFAQCSTENETWLPLVEKAFAKAHGDYRAIDGGFTGYASLDLCLLCVCSKYKIVRQSRTSPVELRPKYSQRISSIRTSSGLTSL